MMDPELLVYPLQAGEESMEMEVDRGTDSTHAEKVAQCTDKDCSSNSMHFLTLYNKDLLYTRTQQQPTTLSDYASRVISTRKRYDVRKPIGYALLLYSDQIQRREGTRLYSTFNDVLLMRDTLKNGGWEVSYLTSAVDRGALMREIETLGRKEQDLDRYSIFLFYYTGHGSAEGVVLSDSETVSYFEIVTKISAIETLAEKPKVFIFDSCREKQPEAGPGHNYVVSKTPFHEEIRDAQKLYSGISYPPRHTMICHSAALGQASFADQMEGSLYTLTLSQALRQLGEHLSLPEIITQVGGGTYEVACYCNQNQYQDQRLDQRPVFISNLEKQLVLSTDFEAIERDSVMMDIMETQSTVIQQETQQNPWANHSLVIKGGRGPVEDSAMCGPVERDVIIPKNPKIKSEWKTREHVMSNLKNLGSGVSIFFIYASNPDNPYEPAGENKNELRNRILMSQLFFDLTSHGFHVLSDLHLGDTEPSNWVQWYITRITCCNFVICVCSPAFKELFQEMPDIDKVVDPRAKRLLAYRNAVYACLSNELSKPGPQKFIPVILDDYETVDCVPLLFQCGTSYRILPGDQKRRLFNYDDRSRDFNRLICHMAGINRAELDTLNQPQISQIPILGNPFQKSLVGKERALNMLSGPPPGYVVGQYPGPQRLVASSQQPQPALGNYGGGHTIPLHHRPTNAVGIPQHPISLVPTIPQLPSQPHLQPHPHPQAIDDPNTLPLKTPHRKIFLWLADQVMSWKFFARRLGVEDRDIEVIEIEHRGVSERCYQVLLKWEQQHYKTCNYCTLGKALKEDNKNSGLYMEYVKMVKDVEGPK